jgi:hypothetical protein
LLQKWLGTGAASEFKTVADIQRRHNMHRDEEQAEIDYGQLMACLLRERDSFATESDFHAFALKSVRRFIVDLRSLDIELMMRPRYLSEPPLRPPSGVSSDTPSDRPSGASDIDIEDMK